MSIGDQWGAYGMGEMDKQSSFALLDAFYAAGGNFIDTANGYQDGTSEMFLGEWMEERGVRDQMVVATKVSGTVLKNVTRVWHLFIRVDWVVHHELDARGGPPAEDVLCREQHEVVAPFSRGIAEKAAYQLY